MSERREPRTPPPRRTEHPERPMRPAGDHPGRARVDHPGK
jgi:hypothetical protein